MNVLSPSQIACYARCPQAWYLRYVEGLRGPTSPYAALGVWFHSVLEDAVLGIRNEISADEARKAAVAAGFGAKEATKFSTSIARNVRAFVAETLPTLHPEAVEEWVEGELGGYPVRCRLDYRDAGGYTLDWKLTSKNAATPEWHWEVAIQVALSGVSRGGVCLFDRDGRRRPAIIWLADSARKSAVEDGVRMVGQGIEAGNVPPLGAWCEKYGTCACVYCDYVHVCKHGQPWVKVAEEAAKRRSKWKK